MRSITNASSVVKWRAARREARLENLVHLQRPKRFMDRVRAVQKRTLELLAAASSEVFVAALELFR